MQVSKNQTKTRTVAGIGLPWAQPRLGAWLALSVWLGYNLLRHGRFIIIVDQRENSLYKANRMDAFKVIPKFKLFGTRYYDIHHHRLCFRGK